MAALKPTPAHAIRIVLLIASSDSASSLLSRRNPILKTETVEIDTGARTHPFPALLGKKMFWFGARAILSLRDGYRNDPPRNEAHQPGSNTSRFHAIFP